TTPSSVSVPRLRSYRVTPRSRSSFDTCVDMLDCTVNRALAADENVPWSARATRATSWRRSICWRDGSYQCQRVDRYDALVYTFTRRCGGSPNPRTGRTRKTTPQ